MNVRASRSAGVDPILIPVVGAFVARAGEPGMIGVVEEVLDQALKVNFGPGGVVLLRPGEWACGLRPGFVVRDVPLSAARSSLGTGTVIAGRGLAGREQVLIHLHATGQSRWLPYERLQRCMDASHLYRRAIVQDPQSGERSALKAMAHALRLWNDATGALDRLDVDPLPHQISLVHKIVSSGTINWMIADDVGLGKTVEVGLLLAALERRRNLRRVLLVVPAGLTSQWQEEMQTKFDKNFLTWGQDFQVNDPRQWPTYERVIVSLDLAKPLNVEDDGSDPATRFGMLLAAGTWDVVVFDEAHRLSRGESQTTLRYRLAASLRERTDAMLFLTGTPHQGDMARFQNLLTLVRPDLAPAIQMLEFNPEIVREMIVRNRKIDAVDADGNFIFKGAMVRRIEVPLTDGPRRLEGLLKDYFRQGYAAGDRIGGARGRAVGFVMTIYRKLASSSVFALAVALTKRRARLLAHEGEQAATLSLEGLEQITDVGEGSDLLSDVEVSGVAAPFFESEIIWLDRLIGVAQECFREDPKRLALTTLVTELRKQHKKLLLFTEYRSTQEYLRLAIAKQDVKIALIHGGQKAEEKKAAIQSFEADADVLISTEAGGEGLNLHRRCHVMVNYDLPWNPARLTQRIGRLYRYGQQEQVVVINFHARDTIDNDILSGVMERLERVVAAMQSVNDEYGDRYHAEVMGELLERLDIADLLAEAQRGRVERSDERISAAVEAARRAKELQDEVLRGAERLDPNGWKQLGALSTRHLASFIVRASPLLGIEIETQRNPEVFTLRLPVSLRGRFPEFGARMVIQATTKRGLATRRDQTEMMDFASSFVRFLVREATSPGFGGDYGPIGGDRLVGRLLGVYLSRYQNDQGKPTGEDLIVAVEDSGGIRIDNAALLDLFEQPQITAVPVAGQADGRARRLEALTHRAEVHMAGDCTRYQHPNSLVCVALLEGPQQADG